MHLLRPFPALLIVAAAIAQEPPPVAAFAHENVLGTSLDLRLQAAEPLARTAEKAVLAEIERLRHLLSGHDPDSELRALKPGAGPTPASADLLAVLQACDLHRTRSEGAFDPAVAVFTDLWHQAERAGTPPTQAALAAAVTAANEPHWRLDPTNRTVTWLGNGRVTLDGLAKGYVLDHAAAAARSAGVTAALVDLGGDLCTYGMLASVAVADPRQPADNAPPLCHLAVHDVGVATSGGYARGFTVGGRHFGHVIDPRTGQPVTDLLQATVVAPDAMTADALATALLVLGPGKGLALAASFPGTECLLVGSDGACYASPGWRKLVVDDATLPYREPPHATWPAGCRLEVDFALATPQNQGRRGGYRRPYVAAWIEDGNGRAVRTLALWYQKPKWLPDLRRWSRAYQGRRDSVDAVSRATRAAGRYQLVWDGADDQGRGLPAGRYTLFLEVVREHGTYQLQQQAFEVGTGPAQWDLPANEEVASVTLRLVQGERAR